MINRGEKRQASLHLPLVGYHVNLHRFISVILVHPFRLSLGILVNFILQSISSHFYVLGKGWCTGKCHMLYSY